MFRDFHDTFSGRTAPWFSAFVENVTVSRAIDCHTSDDELRDRCSPNETADLRPTDFNIIYSENNVSSKYIV